MEARLTIVGGKTNKKLVTLKLPTVIGRSREADLTIAHPMVSRQHCELFEVQGLVRVRDLGSLNGTFIGDKQISEAALRPNDEFTIGPLTFRVDYEYAGEVTAVGPSVPEDQDGEPSTVDSAEPDAESPAAPPGAGGIEPPPPFFGEALAVEDRAPADGLFPEFSPWEPPAVEEPPQGALPQPALPQAALQQPAPPAATLDAAAIEPLELAGQPAESPGAEGPRADAVAAETSSLADFTVVDEPARPTAPEAEPSGRSTSEKKPRGWWPFGRGKKSPVAAPQAKPAASAGSNGQEEPRPAAVQALEATASEVDRETLSPPRPKGDTPMPGAPPRISAPPQQRPDDALDPELDAFLRSFE